MAFRGRFSKVSIDDTDHRKMQEWEDLWDQLAGRYAEEVSFATLKDAIQSTNYGWECLPDHVIFETLHSADTNMDGVLQREEFMKIVQTSAPEGVMRRALREAAWCAVPASERDYTKRYYYQHYSCFPPPLFIPIISLIQIGAFIYYAVDMDVSINALSPCPTYSPLVYDPFRRYEAWRFVTYMAVHSGYLHLLSNLVMQLLFGVVLEVVHGPLRISSIYLGGVACGALATSVSAPGFFLAGASGGVYAVQYAHLSNLVMNWDEIRYPIPQVALIGIFSLVDTGYALYDTFFVQEPSHVGHLAHIGGALCGILLGVCVLRNLKKLPWEHYLRIGSAILLSVLVTIVVLVNIFSTSYFPNNDFRAIADIRQEWMAENHFGYHYQGA